MAASLNPEDEDQLQAWQRISQEKGFPGSSAGKASICNARNSGLISRSGSSPGEGIGYPLLYSWAFPVAQMIESACNVGDLGSIPGSGRSPGGEHGNPPQYSCLETPHGQRNLVSYNPWGSKQQAKRKSGP